jgi:methionyl-tRNA synthetase
MSASARAEAVSALVEANRTGPPQIVTAAFPFVPAELGLQHFASTYLPADTLNRVYKFLGYRSALGGGTDVHSSIQVSRDGRTRAGADRLCDAFDLIYRRAFESFNVAYDVYLRTDEEAHVWLTHAALGRLEADGGIHEGPGKQLRCAACNAAPPARLTHRIGQPPACPWCCSEVLRKEQVMHLFLDLERLRGAIEGALVLDGGARRWIADILAKPLVPWCVTRDNDVGIPLHRKLPGKSIYLWFESLVGYATLARALEARGFASAEAEFRHFFGKNILYHHGILWPAIGRAGLRIENRAHACLRGFAESDCGWAQRHWGDPALRLYTLLKVPDDGRDFRLVEADYLKFRSGIVNNKIRNLMQRLALRESKPEKPFEPDPEWWAATEDTITMVARFAERGEVRRIAEEILRHVRQMGSLSVRRGLFWSEAASDRRLAWGIRRFCLALLNLLAPGLRCDGETGSDQAFLAGPARRIDVLHAHVMGIQSPTIAAAAGTGT